MTSADNQGRRISNVDASLRRPVFLFVLAILTITASYFRLSDLDFLGFYGDEETTAFVSQSVATGNGFHMPSGLEYYRAVPHTLANALSASVFGTSEEMAYRVPAAIAGIVTVVVLGLGFSGLLPIPVSLLAALLLALSDWHILTSREARMYAPFLLLFLTSGALVVRWAGNWNWWRVSLVSIFSAFTVLVHTLGIFLLIVILAWMCTNRSRPTLKNRAYSAILLLLVPAMYFLVSRLVIGEGFSEWRRTGGRSGLEPTVAQAKSPLFDIAGTADVSLLAGIVGIAVGAWLGKRTLAMNPGRPAAEHMLAVYLLCAAAVAAIYTANLHLAFLLGSAMLLVHPIRTWNEFSNLGPPIIVISAGGFVALVLALTGVENVSEIRKLFMFPFPYLWYFWDLSPALLVLFLAGAIVSVLGADSAVNRIVRVLSLVVLGVVSVIGAISQWGGIRYLIAVYPFMLLVASFALYVLARELAHRWQATRMPVAIAIVLSIAIGMIPGHSLKSAVAAHAMDYGPFARPLILGFPVYPDHKGAGEYLRSQISPDEPVVVEDILQMYWYARRPLYWLSDPGRNAQFMYRDEAGIVRDIYTGNQVLMPQEIDAPCLGGRTHFWLATSGEAIDRRNLSLASDQRRMVEQVESRLKPIYEGRDGVSGVYRVACGSP